MPDLFKPYTFPEIRDCPPIDEELIRHLDQVFPNMAPSLTTSDARPRTVEELALLVASTHGERLVVGYLSTARAMQQGLDV